MSVTVRTQNTPTDRKTDGSSCSEFHNKLPRHLPEVAVQVKHVTCGLKLQRHGNSRRKPGVKVTDRFSVCVCV